MNSPKPAKGLASYFELQSAYQRLFEEYRARGVQRQMDPNDNELVMDAAWKKAHYFSAGEDALRVIVGALVANRRGVPASILDLPSGSGRVTRHLQAFFPDSRIVACDLYESHVKFCVDELKVEGVISRENLDDLKFDTQFDVIFCGSLLTHLPEDKARQTLKLFRRILSPTGIAIVTFQGRHSDYIQRHKWKYLDDRLYSVAEEEVVRDGFGYVDYKHDFKSLFDKQAQYGIALVRPHWVSRLLEAERDIRLLGYCERDWDDHQDVAIFGRPGIDE